MSLIAAHLAATMCFAAPPPPPPTEPATEAPEGATEPATEGEASPEGPAEEGEAPPPPETPAEGVEGPAEPPVDERYDPVLPYGESEDPAEGLQYAEETPPPADIQYAEESPPSDDVGYDQSRQRPAPNDDALARESDEADDLGEREFRGRKESPQRFAVEIKFGPYLPNVDKRAGSGLGPYATVFGETDDMGVAIDQPKQGLYSVLGFEWQFVDLAGPLSIGTTVGFFRDTADAIITEPTADATTIRSSADSAAFSVIPVTLLLGYRFELMADRWRVPLVPYARGGVGYGFWIATKGARNDRTTNEAGEDSRGGTWGWQANLGLMLRLDFIERAAGLELDRAVGINHTYLFGEWQFSRLDGFGSDTSMVVGDDTYLLGLAVEF